MAFSYIYRPLSYHSVNWMADIHPVNVIIDIACTDNNLFQKNTNSSKLT